MKRPGKLTFYLGLIFIACFFACVVNGVVITDKSGDSKEIIRGVDDIRWGTDVLGGVSVTFSAGTDVDGETMELLRERLKTRLGYHGLTDYELYLDSSSNSILVSFPWVQNVDGDAVRTIDFLSETGCIRVVEGRPDSIEGIEKSSDGEFVSDSAGQKYHVLMNGDFIEEAFAGYDDLGNRTVTIQFDEEGTALLADCSARRLGDFITVWLDDRLLSTMAQNSLNISGAFTIGKWGGLDDAAADEILKFCEIGALPVQVRSTDYEITDPAFADDTLHILIAAGLIALCLMFILLIAKYRLPGFIACAALVGHIAGLLAAASGFLPVLDGVTLTLPGIAGLIVSVGIAVDANIITAERIKEEVLKGKSLHRSISFGCRASFSSIFDGNMTMLIVAVILIGVFGPPKNICSIILSPFLWLFPRATTDTIYAFGYMLFFGVVFNFVMGVIFSRLMLRAAYNIKYLKRRWLYGGERHKEVSADDEKKAQKL